MKHQRQRVAVQPVSESTGGCAAAMHVKACHAGGLIWKAPPPCVVLWQPEIPQNTGNIARLCAGLGAPLHLVEPLGFALTSARVRRAGLDYWEHVALRRHRDFAAFTQDAAPTRCWLLSTRGTRSYTSVRYAHGDALVFGSETRGLPRALLAAAAGRALHIPMLQPAVRSLNLANAVSVVLYEALRQLGVMHGLGPTPGAQPSLWMRWPPTARPRSSACALPEGLALRCFRAGDEQAYLRLMQAAGFTGFSERDVEQTCAAALPEGIFFLECTGSKKLVATACAQHRPRRDYPSGGELGWVAVDPEHTGQGLGLLVSHAALQRFRRAGYACIYLMTHDFRLPAVKTYLKLGFKPEVRNEAQAEHWRQVCSALGWPFDPGRALRAGRRTGGPERVRRRTARIPCKEDGPPGREEPVR